MSIRDEFEMLHELGRGGVGSVFAARHRTSGREVAIKALLTGNEKPGVRERFLREAQVRLDSQHIVQVLDLRDEDEQVYMIQELVPGRSLEDLLEQQGQLPLEHALGILGLFADLVRSGRTVLLASHDLNLIAPRVQGVAILHEGRILMDGAPSEIVAHEDVRRVYLGERFNW